jgi:hypothetical protein
MALLRQVGIGVQAGLLAGGFVAATFFVADFARLAPLATPMALSGGILGSAATAFDSPFLISSIAIVAFGGHLAGITLVHLLAFATLGAVAVLVCHACHVPLNALTAALYGLVVFSLVFYTATWLTNAASVVELPSLGSVLLVNLLAGAVMGGYCQLASRSAGHTA